MVSDTVQGARVSGTTELPGAAGQGLPPGSSQEQGSWGQPQASGTSLGQGPIGGTGSAGPMARQCRAVGGWRVAPLRRHWGRGCWPRGADVGSWAGDRVGGAPGRGSRP